MQISGGDRQGNWLLTDTEQAQLQQAAQKLLATGMVVEQVAELLGLSTTEVQALEEKIN